jgi:pimeloyl-ACP methyl ester carboxylesterase
VVASESGSDRRVWAVEGANGIRHPLAQRLLASGERVLDVPAKLATRAPARAAGVFFFACNMDPGGTKVMEPSPVIDRCFARHRKDYASLSATPDGFEPFVAAVGEMMRTQPNYTARDLAAIDVPVAIVQGEHDEFIRPEHAAYLARTIPGGMLTILPGVSHFAPLQRPARFNAALLAFLDGLPG